MPLKYVDRGMSGAVLHIMSGQAIVGKLWKAMLRASSGETVRWQWSWQAGPGAGPQQHGSADNLEWAKAQIEAQWRAWLDVAGLVERE